MRDLNLRNSLKLLINSKNSREKEKNVFILLENKKKFCFKLIHLPKKKVGKFRVKFDF